MPYAQTIHVHVIIAPHLYTMRVGAICPNPAGQVDTLKQILEWQKGGAEEEDTMDVYNIHGFQVHVLQHPLYMCTYFFTVVFPVCL